VRRKNLIAGAICLAVLPCFALFAVAQQQQPGAPPAAARQSVEATHYITMPPGFSIRYESPKPFTNVQSGNPDVAVAVPSGSDRVLVITSKAVEGQTNFLLLNGNGQEVGNVIVVVATPDPERPANKVVVHNKLNNLAGFTNYVCNPICIRVPDPMEGGDRVPLQNLSTQNQNIYQTQRIDQAIRQTGGGGPPP
jgi:hypothetical protein